MESNQKDFTYHMHKLIKSPKTENFECKGYFLFGDKSKCQGEVYSEEKFCYRCNECNYEVCNRCCLALEKNEIEKKSFAFYVPNFHPHPLFKTDEDDGWGCDGRKIFTNCKSGINGYHQTNGFIRFRCSSCDFDFYEKCLLYI